MLAFCLYDTAVTVAVRKSVRHLLVGTTKTVITLALTNQPYMTQYKRISHVYIPLPLPSFVPHNITDFKRIHLHWLNKNMPLEKH
jgi:hypothetical protein